MDFKTFYFQMTKAERNSFAERCKTTTGHLQNVAYGYKEAGESLCINIERESDGQVRCETLRGDVDWAVLRNSKERRRSSGQRANDSVSGRRHRHIKPAP